MFVRVSTETRQVFVKAVKMQRIRLSNILKCNPSTLYLPTTMSSCSVACGLMRVQMSIVNKVLLLLKMEAREDMRAANITASIRPRKPAQKQGEPY